MSGPPGDTTSTPPLPLDERLDLYRWMRLTRTLDNTVMTMWKQGRGVGGTFSGKGHEAIAVGAAYALREDDVIAPMHRDLGSYLVRGLSPERILANQLGKATGVTRGRDANLHGLGDLSLGLIGFVSHLPQSMGVAVGAAMAFAHRGEDRVAMTFVGDGSSNTGLFHEALNLAAVSHAPFVCIIENNQYAYSTPLEQQMAIHDIALRGPAHGVPAVTVDGNDVEVVHTTAMAAVERARAGGGPSLIEAKTMRMLGHAIHDGAEYVPQELLAEWSARDPIVAYRDRLRSSGVEETTLVEIDEDCKAIIARAVEHAEAAPLPEPTDVESGVYADDA